MTASSAVVPIKKPSLIETMAADYRMDPDKFAATIKATCMPANASVEDFAAFLMVAQKHKLNPVTREIYAFPKKGGGIQPIVGVDGWMTLINSHPDFDGMEFEDEKTEKTGELIAITCRIYRKDRSHPVAVTEYMEECKRPTEPWQKWPARMLRHKAAIQAARYAFSFSGIIDPEEAERSPEVITERVVAPAPAEIPAAPPPVTEAEIVDAVEAEETPAEILAKAETWFGNSLTVEDLERALGELRSALDNLPQDDIDTLRKLYSDRLEQLEPNPLPAG